MRRQHRGSAAPMGLRAAAGLVAAAAIVLSLAGPALAGAATGPDLQVSVASDARGPLSRAALITYSIVVTNVGDAEAHHVTVHDEIPMGLHVHGLPSLAGGTCSVTSSVASDGREAWTVDCVRDGLHAADSLQLDIQAEVQQEAHCGTITNAAEASAADEAARSDDRQNYDEVTDSILCRPSIDLVQSGPDVAHVGDEVSFTFTVTNDGERPFVQIGVKGQRCDDAPTISDRGDGDGSLDPAESWTLACTHVVRPSEVDPVRNPAEVSGTTEEGRTVSAAAGHVVDVVHPRCRINVWVSPSSGQPGDVVTYTYVVWNTGDTALFDVRVRDDLLGPIATRDRLAPGQKATAHAQATLAATDVPAVSQASARGVDALGLAVIAQDETSVTVVEGTQPGTHGPGGTPFTGADTTLPTAAGLALAALGAVSLCAARRRIRRT